MSNWTFTPETYEVRFPADEAAERYGVVGLMRRLTGVLRPYTVYVIDGVASPRPGVGPSQDSDAAADDGPGRYGKAIFEGGNTYPLSSSVPAEAAILVALVAAGYGGHGLVSVDS